MVKVESAVDGEAYTIHEEPSIERLKYELSLHQGVSPADQILLYGPPYKVLDPYYQPTLDFAGRRVFLFDRKVLSDANLTPAKAVLPNLEHFLSSAEHDLPHSSAYGEAQSEQLTQLQNLLLRARFYEQYIQESIQSFRKCVAQQKVQKDAVNAAIENMKDIFEANSKQFKTVEEEFVKSKAEHDDLLGQFESRLQQLKDISLHPSIVAAMESKMLEQKAEGFVFQTLYDCIPIERERILYTECYENHAKVSESFNSCSRFFESLAERVSKFLPVSNELSQDGNLSEADRCAKEQVEDMQSLREAYQNAYSSARSNAETLTNHEGRSKEFAEGYNNVFQKMKSRCNFLRKLKEDFQVSRDETNALVYATLRLIAQVQSEIQFKLKREVEWFKKWLTAGGDRYFKHIRQIYMLPQCYAAMLHEMIRRNAFERALLKDVGDIQSRIENRQATEITKREDFMKLYGVNLPPIFFKVFPTLKEKPIPVEGIDTRVTESLPDIEEFTEPETPLHQEEQASSSKGKRDAETSMSGSLLSEREQVLQLREELDQLQSKLRETASRSSTALDLSSLANPISNLYKLVNDGEVSALLPPFPQSVSTQEDGDSPTLEVPVGEGRILQHTPALANILDRVENMILLLKRKTRYPEITFMDFQIGDIALFMPAYVNNRKIWMAFNSGFPYRFLAEESLAIFLHKNKSKEQRASIIGKIYLIDKKTADSEDNDYNIPVGTIYYVCYAEPLYRHVVFGHSQKLAPDNK